MRMRSPFFRCLVISATRSFSIASPPSWSSDALRRERRRAVCFSVTLSRAPRPLGAADFFCCRLCCSRFCLGFAFAAMENALSDARCAQESRIRDLQRLAEEKRNHDMRKVSINQARPSGHQLGPQTADFCALPARKWQR